MAISKAAAAQYGAIVRNSTHRAWESGVLSSKSVIESSVVHLTDPKSNDQLLILGTSNVSTSNAYRVFEVAEHFKPTSVLLQVSPSFGKYTYGNWASSEAFQDNLKSSGYYWDLIKQSHYGAGFKVALFEVRKLLMWYWINAIMRTPSDTWRFFLPGLDSKLIFDYASKNKLPVHYAGEDFNGAGMQSLRGEPRMDVIYSYIKYFFNLNDSWESEVRSMQTVFKSHSAKAIAEGHLNQDNVAWLVKFAEKMIPHQKKAIIDKRDEDIFWEVEKRMKGERKLVLVNMWHVDGVQKFWRMYHGIERPRTPMINTKDLPLEEIQAWMRGKDLDRSIIEKRTGDPMALPDFRENPPYWDQNRSHYG